MLANGKRVTSAFGYLGGKSGAWRSEAVIPLIIEYKDLESERYRARMNLILVDDNGFGQSSWAISSNSESETGAPMCIRLPFVWLDASRSPPRDFWLN